MGSSSHVLTRGDSVGLTIVVEAGLLSLVAVCSMFVYMICKMRPQRRRNPLSWRLPQEPMGLYLLLLFFADMVQGLGAVMGIRWIYYGEVVPGSFCTAQGAIQQLGETSVAMITLVIALHTFVSVWWDKGAQALNIAKVAMIVVWLYVILFVAIGISVNQHKDYEVPTPYWCWIGENFLMQRIFGEYIWFWLTLLVSIVAYVPLYLCSRGNITVNPDVWWKFRIHRAQNRDDARTRALGLIAYPLIYSVLILPLSAVRWLEFVQERHGGKDNVPPAATFTVASIYFLSGAANVLLFSLTRPYLLFPNEVELDHGQLPNDIHLRELRDDGHLPGNGHLPYNGQLPP